MWKGAKKKKFLHLPILPSTWLVKIGMNFQREEVLVWRTLIFRCNKVRTNTMPQPFNNCHIFLLLVIFLCAQQPWLPPNIQIFKYNVHERINAHNKSQKQAGEYYVVGRHPFHTLGYGVVINISPRRTINIGFPFCVCSNACPNFTRMCFLNLEKKGNWVHYKHLQYVY